MGPDLSAAEVLHAEQSKLLAEITRKITIAMENYNGLVSVYGLTLRSQSNIMMVKIQCNTLSEIFISWDDILSTVEAHVSALERQRKEKT